MIKLRSRRHSGSRAGAFNLTPVIDIVFLLIIFFMVVCKFIEAENFPVAVPQACDAAETENKPESQLTTVTVMKDDDDAIIYAVGARKVDALEQDVSQKLRELVEENLAALPAGRRIVSLRVDKDIEFAVAQYALAAIADSSATDVQMAVLEDEENAPAAAANTKVR